MSTSKPKLAQLKTPLTATFPSELSALSARTPISAVPDMIKEEYAKTPISPPLAYMDFLKAMSATSPVIPEKRPSSSSEEDDEAEETGAVDSMPSTASSEQTDCSCNPANWRSFIPSLVCSSFAGGINSGIPHEFNNSKIPVQCTLYQVTFRLGGSTQVTICSGFQGHKVVVKQWEDHTTYQRGCQQDSYLHAKDEPGTQRKEEEDRVPQVCGNITGYHQGPSGGGWDDSKIISTVITTSGNKGKHGVVKRPCTL